MKHWMILAALLAGGAQAQTQCVTAAGSVVTSADGRCWQASASPRLAEAPARPALAADVLFAFDSVELTPGGMKQLDELARGLLAADAGEIVASAHADRLGTDEHNLALSARRADVVRAYLEERGVPLGRVRVEAQGAAKPLTGTVCEGLGEESRRNAKLVACLAPDRRVEIRTGD